MPIGLFRMRKAPYHRILPYEIAVSILGYIEIIAYFYRV
jgi:hypothetical protein